MSILRIRTWYFMNVLVQCPSCLLSFFHAQGPFEGSLTECWSVWIWLIFGSCLDDSECRSQFLPLQNKHVGKMMESHMELGLVIRLYFLFVHLAGDAANFGAASDTEGSCSWSNSVWWVTDCWFRHSAYCQYRCANTVINVDTLNRMNCSQGPTLILQEKETTQIVSEWETTQNGCKCAVHNG